MSIEIYEDVMVIDGSSNRSTVSNFNNFIFINCCFTKSAIFFRFTSKLFDRTIYSVYIETNECYYSINLKILKIYFLTQSAMDILYILSKLPKHKMTLILNVHIFQVKYIKSLA